MAAIQSMTAFARREAVHPWGSLACEIRSVNHRYLDVQSRLPDALRQIETSCREALRQRIARGKVDLAVRLQFESAGGNRLSVNEAFLAELRDACRQVERISGALATPSALEMLRWPGVIAEAAVDPDVVAREAVALFGAALTELVEMRTREGAKLVDFLLQRLRDIDAMLDRLHEDTPRIVAELRQRVRDRVADLQVELAPERLEQEVVLLAAKADVAEEIDRLRTHVAETRRTLQQGGACGRRLDFLMQEFNREANTLSSKSASADTTHCAVELKVLVEQMREQVQNIE